MTKLQAILILSSGGQEANRIHVHIVSGGVEGRILLLLHCGPELDAERFMML